MPRTPLRHPHFLVGAVAFALLAPRVAVAQFGGGGGGMRPMGPGMGGQPPPSAAEPEKEQAAEAAPEQHNQEPTVTPLPSWPAQREKAIQFFQLNGYMRGRGYFFHQLDLGIVNTSSSVVSPFVVPFSEALSNTGNSTTCSSRNGNNGCRSQDISSADMRLRLEPTINVSDQVRIKAQIDVFDNLVLGSTAEGFYINGVNPSREVSTPIFTRSQASPQSGLNALTGSVVAKRAWAEVRTPIGELRFGRMGSHWGLGIFQNDGNCLDCDHGVTVDRLMFATQAFNHFLVLMADWVYTGPTTGLYNPNQNGGQQYAADPLISTMQFGGAIGRQDKPEDVRERVERGEAVLNYGGYFVYRSQGWDLNTNPNLTIDTLATNSSNVTPQTLQQLLTRRNAWTFTPDLWLRLEYRKFKLEAEAVLIGGQIGPPTNQPTTSTNTQFVSGTSPVNILQFGGVARIAYRLLHDTLHLGLEIGFASGDGAEDPNGAINYRTAKRSYGAGRGVSTISNFSFDPDYHVDLILFRRIVGAVTNATYFKPHVQYDVLDNLFGRIDAIYSIANNAVGWPGNDHNLGLELDGSIWYHNDEEGFSAGVAYGVLFPFAGLNYPGVIYSAGPGGGDLNAQVAQTVQGRVMVKF